MNHYALLVMFLCLGLVPFLYAYACAKMNEYDAQDRARYDAKFNRSYTK